MYYYLLFLEFGIKFKKLLELYRNLREPDLYFNLQLFIMQELLAARHFRF